MTKRKVSPEKPEAEMTRFPSAVTPGRVVSDPFGSYTGVPLFPLELPVQDADDL